MKGRDSKAKGTRRHGIQGKTRRLEPKREGKEVEV